MGICQVILLVPLPPFLETCYIWSLGHQSTSGIYHLMDLLIAVNGPDRVHTLYSLKNLNTVYVLSCDKHGKG